MNEVEVERPGNRWERRFWRARNAALAVGGTALAAYPTSVALDKPGSGFFWNAAVVSVAAASNLEMWRFAASPDSDRKRRIMNRLSKAAAVIQLSFAAFCTVEGVTLVANNTETVTAGTVNMRNFVTQDEDWVPETNGEIAGYAIADGVVAVAATIQGVSALRRKPRPYQPSSYQFEEPS